MTRRSILLAAAAGFVAIMAIWSYGAWRQYRLEEQLVGTWCQKNSVTGEDEGATIVLSSDGRSESSHDGRAGTPGNLDVRPCSGFHD